MGLTKQYLRYAASGTFNIIASPQCNHALITFNNQEGRYVAVGAAQHVFIWDMKLGEKVQVLNGENAAASCIAATPTSNHLAVGYTDGILKVFQLNAGHVVNNFCGHKNEITALAFDYDEHRIASGAKDNAIIIWDSIADVGICRLSGHKDQITQILFMNNNKRVLISASKDTFIKFWHLQTNHCFQTLTGHRTEVWDMSLMKNGQYLISGCGDSELRVWKLQTDDDNDNDNDDLPMKCDYVGSILRASKGRVVCMKSDWNQHGQILVTHGTDHQIEVFKFCSDAETQSRFKRRQKKQKHRNIELEITSATSTSNQQQQQHNDMNVNVNEEMCLRDEVRRLKSIELKERAKSVDVILGIDGEVRVSCVLNKNSVALYSLKKLNESSFEMEAKCLRHICGHHGHQTEIRSLHFSSDNLAMLSASSDSIKVWNQTSQTCLRTIYMKAYVLCVCFVAGDRHALVGLKNGHLLIVDISVGDVLEDIPAHDQELWTICVTPTMKGCVTGGGDCTVKFWNYQLIVDVESSNDTKVLSLAHTKTLKLDETILCIKISSNNQFIAIGLLDSTIKVFFIDTLKFYLTLYGHKLPILCMDMSHDCNIIASGSADRNVKIWGLDFGDCHKSLFAHNDSITALQFVHKTHYFFTSSQDGCIKEWDADSYQLIITLNSHIGQVFTLTVSPNGKYLLSSGSDFTLRLWQCTDEMIVLQDAHDDENVQLATGDDTIVAGKGQVIRASRKTIGSERGAELIMECLQTCMEYEQQQQQLLALPMMQAFQSNSVHDFILKVLKTIRSSDLDESLLLLPFNDVRKLLELLANHMSVICIHDGGDIELVMRIVCVLVKIHLQTIHSCSNLGHVIATLHNHLLLAAHNYRDTIAYNLHNLLFLQKELQQQQQQQETFTTNQLSTKRATKIRQEQKRERKRILMTCS